MRRLQVTWALRLLVAMLPCALRAQVVTLDGPPGTLLPGITPAFTVRANGLGPARPFLITLQISTSADFSGGIVLDSSFAAPTPDSVVAIQVTRPLPSEAQVFWRVRVRALAGPVFDSPVTGPRTVPRWLSLLSPSSSAGDILDARRPMFVWRSAPVSPAAGVWNYDVEITTGGRPQSGATRLTDTTFRPPADLQANTSYRWSVRAYLRGGESITASSVATFVIIDPPLPTSTLFYQNFPNPFPTPTAFSTCFWFDIGEPGGAVSLEVLDIRGNLVRTIIPGNDGQREFLPGRYGRGAPGAGGNCDNRFVWDGTANDGRTAARGVYQVKFRFGTQGPSFIRVFFLGR